jgi:Zn-dependent protease
VFRHTIPIGRVLRIPIDLDYSWFLIAVLTTWVLAVSYYPAEFKGGTSAEYWLMGAVTAVLFFVSILVHELAHSRVASATRYPFAGSPCSSLVAYPRLKVNPRAPARNS